MMTTVADAVAMIQAGVIGATMATMSPRHMAAKVRPTILLQLYSAFLVE